MVQNTIIRPSTWGESWGGAAEWGRGDTHTSSTEGEQELNHNMENQNQDQMIYKLLTSNVDFLALYLLYISNTLKWLKHK